MNTEETVSLVVYWYLQNKKGSDLVRLTRGRTRYLDT